MLVDQYQAFLGKKNPERFNKDLMKTKSNDNLKMYMNAICNALTVIPGIEYLGCDIRPNNRLYTETDGKKEVDVSDSILDIMTIRFKLSRFDEEVYINKDIYFPKLIDDQYFLISGNKYIPVFQCVDAGTYRNKDCLTLKTLLMPIKLRFVADEIEDIEGNKYTGYSFKIDMFKNKLNPFTYYLSKNNIENVIEFFGMECILSEEPLDLSNQGIETVNFQIGKNNFIVFEKEWLDKSQSNLDVAITFINNFNNRSKMNDQDYWVKKLGSNFTKNSSQQVEKANGILLSFERVLDGVTKEILRTEEENKKDIYHIIRWMMFNYRLLSKQDTLDLANKRLRLYEYILNPLLLKFSKSTYRLLNSRQITVHNLKTIFSNIHKGTLVKEIVKNELVRYKNSVNTYDLFTVFLKVTNSGPQTSFASGNVNVKFRDIHVSMIDRIDLCSTANGDPGSNATLTPFCQLYKNMHFSENPTYVDDLEDVEETNIND